MFLCPEGFAYDIESNDCVECNDDGSFTPFEEVKNKELPEPKGEDEDPLDMFKKYGVKEIQKGKKSYKL